MKLSMSKNEFAQIITDKLNMGPAILAGRVITKVDFPPRYSASDEVEIEFGIPNEARTEEMPAPIPVPLSVTMPEDELEPF